MTYEKKVLVIILFLATILANMSLEFCTSCTQSNRDSIIRSIPNTDSDKIKEKTLSPEWIMINKNSDSNLSLTGINFKV